MSFLEWVESTGIAVFVRESPSFFGYTFVLSLHAIGLAIVVGISGMVALRMLGRFKDIPLEPMVELFPLMYTGFTINAISGFMLLAANATGMLTMVMFYIKMAFIVAAMVSLTLARRRFAVGRPAAEARGLAVAVLAFWMGAVVAGRLTAYPYLVASWFGT
jgi:hypothetical protein